MLLVSCCQGPLDAFTRGIASRLGMSYRSSASAEEIASLLDPGLPAVLVIWQEEFDGTGLSLTRRASLCPGVFIICVADVLTPESACAAQRSGAISCMSTEVALESLHDVVARIRSGVMALLQSVVPKTREIRLGRGLVLLAPDYKVTDGQLESRLPPTPGRLLECLTNNLGRVVPFGILMQEAWDRHDSVRREALHQQIHVLKGVLDIYGVSDWVRCRRGIGYLLDPTGECIRP